MSPRDDRAALRAVGISHTSSHHATYQRKMAVEIMQRHSRSKKHFRTEAFSAFPSQYSPIMVLFPGSLAP